MTYLLANNEFVIVSHFDSIYVLKIRTNESILLNSQHCSQKISNILAICISKDGTYFSASDDQKLVFIFKTHDWKFYHSVTAQKRVTSMLFTKTNNILLADKAGDVYEYTTNGNVLKFLMGHVSMLLQLTLCKDENYLATCDRDEKIRVSNYPDCYDIQQYCLFHSDFVSQIVYLEKHDILISGSGDGYLVVWDYMNGRVLNSLDCLPHLIDDSSISDKNSKVCKFSVSHLNEEREPRESYKTYEGKSNTFEGTSNKCRGCDVKKMVHLPDLDLVAVTFERWSCVLIFLVDAKELRFLKCLSTKGNIHDICCHGNELLVLGDVEKEFLTAFSFVRNENEFSMSPSTKHRDMLCSVNENLHLFKQLKSVDSMFPSLHKVHIDNISVYVERKRVRVNEKEERNLKRLK